MFRPTALFAATLLATVAGSSSIQAQTPSVEPPANPQETKTEIKAVFRLMKAFIDAASNQEIALNVSFRESVLGVALNGVIHGRGQASTELRSTPHQERFVLNSHGSAYTNATGTRGPFVLRGQASGPFTGETVVHFDGKHFSLVGTQVTARVGIDVDCVGTVRNGPLGRAVGRAALRLGQPLIPRAECQATPIAKSILRQTIDERGARIIAELNEKTPVEESVNRVYPNTRDWVFQVSSTIDYMQAAYGPPGAETPELPDNPKRVPDAFVEVWLRSNDKEAKLLAELSSQPLAQQLVQKYLETTLPKLAALSEERSVAAIGSWVVISVGAPPKKAKTITLP